MNIKKLLMEEIGKYISQNSIDYDFSLFIVGSVNRGDYMLDEKGKILSDIDVLVVIEERRYIDKLNMYLKDVCRYIFDKFDYKLGIIYSIKSVILKRKNAMFLQDVSSKDFIVDNLDIGKFFDINDFRTEIVLAEYFQSLFYYEAKYNFTNDDRTRVKINILINCIYELIEFGERKTEYNLDKAFYDSKLSVDRFGIGEDLKDKYNYILGKATELHLSSMYFLSHKFLNAEDLFFNVRDIVFLENEGICYYDAIQT